MNETPSAVSYNHQGKQQLYAFVRGQDGHLYVNFYDVSNSEWKWSDQGVPGGNVSISSGAEAVVANLYDGNGRALDMIYVFVTGNDGRLYAHIWDGTRWKWEECHTPGGLRLGSKHSTVVWQDAHPRLDNIRVFCWGIRANSEPELWEANLGTVDRTTWTYNWTWENRGTHSNVLAIASNPGALKQLPYPPALYAFVRGTDDRLYMHYQPLRPALPPRWYDHDIPLHLTTQQRATVVSGPGVVSVSNKIYAFIRGDDGHLWINHGNYEDHGDCTVFNWHDCGAPANGVNVSDEPGIMAYTWQGQEKIYAFVRGDNGHLYVWHGVGTNGQWAHQETPTGAQVASAPGVITHVHGGKEQIYVFIWGDDHKLHLHYWDAPQQRWCWRRQGAQWGLNDPGGDIRCL